MAVALFKKENTVKELVEQKNNKMLKFELSMIYIALIRIYGEEGKRVYLKLECFIEALMEELIQT